MSGSDWTEAEIVTAKTLWQDGKSAGEISAVLPGRTRNAILGFIDRHRDIFGMRSAASVRATHSRQVVVGIAQARAARGESPTAKESAKHRAKASPRIASPAPMATARTVEAEPANESLPHGWKRDGRADRSLAGFVVPGVEPVAFKALGFSQCRFMLAEFRADDGGETSCCGAPAEAGKSWCADHMKLVWSKRRAKLAGEADKARPVRVWA